jgi:hypothetical protein
MYILVEVEDVFMDHYEYVEVGSKNPEKLFFYAIQDAFLYVSPALVNKVDNSINFELRSFFEREVRHFEITFFNNKGEYVNSETFIIKKLEEI